MRWPRRGLSALNWTQPPQHGWWSETDADRLLLERSLPSDLDLQQHRPHYESCLHVRLSACSVFFIQNFTYLLVNCVIHDTNFLNTEHVANTLVVYTVVACVAPAMLCRHANSSANRSLFCRRRAKQKPELNSTSWNNNNNNTRTAI